jgi:hypothetical protein
VYTAISVAFSETMWHVNVGWLDKTLPQTPLNREFEAIQGYRFLNVNLYIVPCRFPPLGLPTDKHNDTPRKNYLSHNSSAFYIFGSK